MTNMLPATVAVDQTGVKAHLVTPAARFVQDLKLD